MYHAKLLSRVDWDLGEVLNWVYCAFDGDCHMVLHVCVSSWRGCVCQLVLVLAYVRVCLCKAELCVRWGAWKSAASTFRCVPEHTVSFISKESTHKTEDILTPDKHRGRSYLSTSPKFSSTQVSYASRTWEWKSKFGRETLALPASLSWKKN